MAGNLIRTEVEELIATVTLANPNRRNALSVEMMQALIEEMRALGERSDVRVIILAGEGPAFSAGHDLREMTCGVGEAEVRRIFETCTELMTLVQTVPQPVIARIDGTTTAAGCQLVASCDLALASDRSTFATPGVRIGLFCSTPMVPLMRSIGRKRAMEMLLTGRPIDAAAAADWGLINRAVSPEDLAAETRALALQIAEASPLTVAIGKKAFYAQIDLSQAAAYAHTSEVMIANATTADAQEGMTAFLEKRAPVWTGR